MELDADEMSDDAWRHTLTAFRASLPGRGRKTDNDRRFLEALHYFAVQNVR